ncbi:hypothetical protein NDU88_001141 [Pleurodeles waltl]|uniref:Secreted protein n=1 Tax=Pleurodeles waltl TaxID=8319 RepID=A0AAV7LXU6_PLEWA|nr:hypothetical protein NDU88_001141 [Pleurodeles waltl]
MLRWRFKQLGALLALTVKPEKVRKPGGGELACSHPSPIRTFSLANRPIMGDFRRRLGCTKRWHRTRLSLLRVWVAVPAAAIYFQCMPPFPF